MRIILSRKGFDSAAGGCPSPIFPNDTMLALPIPDRKSTIRYQDLLWQGRNLGDLVPQLAGGKPRAHYGAHLDPDLDPSMQPRAANWRPVFGQMGSAQSHLHNQGIAVGDIFLFFGLFRRISEEGRFVPGTPAMHVIWGWLQIGRIMPVDRDRQQLAWAGRHPHLGTEGDPSNTLYVATDQLSLPGSTDNLPGAGIFSSFSPTLRLTAADSRGPSTWLLPEWFHPEGRASALSYHRKPGAWTRTSKGVLLKTVGRGQEFVLNTDHYPEAVPWITDLLANGSSASPERSLARPSL